MDIHKYLIDYLMDQARNIFEELHLEGRLPCASLGPVNMKDVMGLDGVRQATVDYDGNHL